MSPTLYCLIHAFFFDSYSTFHGRGCSCKTYSFDLSSARMGSGGLIVTCSSNRPAGRTRLTSFIPSAPFSASPQTSQRGCSCRTDRTMPRITGLSSTTTTRIRMSGLGFVCSFIFCRLPRTKSFVLIRCRYGQTAVGVPISRVTARTSAPPGGGLVDPRLAGQSDRHIRVANRHCGLTWAPRPFLEPSLPMSNASQGVRKSACRQDLFKRVPFELPRVIRGRGRDKQWQDNLQL
jgi:hypothetical protein